MDVLSLSKIRAQVLQQVFPSGEEPIDIAFCMIGDNLTMSPIEVNGDFSPSKKRDMRIKVLNLFLNKENPDLRQAAELVYFSFDPVMNVDYCFQIFPNNKETNLFIFSSTGKKISAFTPYYTTIDERTEIERAIKAGAGKESSFASLRSKFSKLLGTSKPEQLKVIPSVNSISIDLSKSKQKSENTDNKTKKQVVKESDNGGKTPFERFAIDTILRLNNPQFDEIREKKQGPVAISVTLSTFTKHMIEQFPEWDGLFEFLPQDNHVCISLSKGFDDETTMQAIPCLWRRKSFVENCILFGVLKFVFLDKVHNTFDVLDLTKIDPYKLP